MLTADPRCDAVGNFKTWKQDKRTFINWPIRIDLWEAFRHVTVDFGHNTRAIVAAVTLVCGENQSFRGRSVSSQKILHCSYFIMSNFRRSGRTASKPTKIGEGKFFYSNLWLFSILGIRSSLCKSFKLFKLLLIFNYSFFIYTEYSHTRICKSKHWNS